MSTNVESIVGAAVSAVVGGECTHRWANLALILALILRIYSYVADLVLVQLLRTLKADEVFKLIQQLRAKSFFTTTIHPSI